MRKIIFRGKGIIGGKWCEGHLVTCKNNGRAFITELIEVDEDSWLYWEVDPATVGQYTGLTDNNGTKIFEGDIVAFTFHSDLVEHAHLEERPEITENHVILFHDGSFWMNRIVVPDSLTAQLYGRRVVLESLWKHHIEVIGNIHDNPELAKI